MPLHVDRSTISLDHAQRREWAIDRTPRDAGRTPAAAPAEADVSVSGLGAASHHVELEAVEQAEALVRRLVEAGSGLRGLHADLDPARVRHLISD